MMEYIPQRHFPASIVSGWFLFYHCSYPLVISHNYGKSSFLMGKSSINGPFSMAMLNNQRVK
jgi:hypothetical protein